MRLQIPIIVNRGDRIFKEFPAVPAKRAMSWYGEKGHTERLVAQAPLKPRSAAMWWMVAGSGFAVFNRYDR